MGGFYLALERFKLVTSPTKSGVGRGSAKRRKETGARSPGLALFYNDFSAPVAQHNSLGSEGNHCFGLVLTAAEEQAIREREETTGKSVDILKHPRTCWGPTPKLALIASLAILEGQPKQ